MGVYAITGAPCSGKSALLAMLAKYGAAAFDADRFVHSYYQDPRCRVFKQVKSFFPETAAGGRIDTKRLGSIVFGDRKKLASLEKIVHPAVIRDLKIWIKNNRLGQRTGVAEVQLLFEKGLDKYFDAVILVFSHRDNRVRRAKLRAGLKRGQILTRTARFLSDGDKKNRAQFLVENNASIKELAKKAQKLWIDLNGG